jgi:ABC-type multidrug transport system fused ATPase/permease subunit
MSFNLQTLQTRYFDWMMRMFDYRSKMKIYPVNFNQPWWKIIWLQKKLFIALLVMQGGLSYYDSLAFLWLSVAIQGMNFGQIVVLFGVRILLTLLFHVVFYYNAIFQLSTIHSVSYSATQFFLEVDPIHHSTRSSGKIISKTHQGSDSYESLLDVVTFELLGFVIQTAAVIVTMLQYDIKIGLAVTVSFVLIGALSVSINLWNTSVFKEKRISLEDKVTAVSVENLQQAGYIRSTFATEHQLTKLKGHINNFTSVEGTTWHVDGTGYLLVNILYCLTQILLCYLIFNSIQSGQLSSLVGIGLITIYHQSFSNIRNLGNMTKRLTRSYTRIVDLYDYIRKFGKQTYPVLENENSNLKLN